MTVPLTFFSFFSLCVCSLVHSLCVFMLTQASWTSYHLMNRIYKLYDLPYPLVRSNVSLSLSLPLCFFS